MDVLSLLARAPIPWLARCRVPQDLASVTSTGLEDPLPDDRVDREAVESVWRAAEAFYRTGITPALQLCVRYRGQVVLNRSLGHARGNAPGDPNDAPKVPATPTTPMNVFSAAKLVTAMVIHKLDEQGVLHLEDRVSDFIPKFVGHGKERITLRHILSHRAGIPNIPREALDLDLLDRPHVICDLLCELRPRSRPGRLVAYHAIGGGFLLAEVVRQATGSTIREVLERQIRKPLDLRWLHYGVARDQVYRVAQNAFTGPPVPPPIAKLLERTLGRPLREIIDLSNDERFLSGIVPSGSLITTAEDFSAFLQCLLDGGVLNGVRVFQPRTIRHALNEASYRELDLTLFLPLRYGLGPMLGDSPVGMFGPNSSEAFGHLGLSNVFSWADPERKIAVAFLTTGKPILSLHVIRLVQFLIAIDRAFPRTSDS